MSSLQQGLPKRADTYGRGIEYSFSILVPTSELSTYWQEVGSDVTSLQDKEAGPLWVRRRSRSWKANNQVLITYYCVDNLDTFSVSMVSRKTNYSYTNGEFQFRPEYFGVHRAIPSECSTTKGGTATTARKNIDATDAGIGDWIFDNATTTSAGTANFEACPLEVTFVEPDTLRFLLANTVQTTIYTVRFTGKTSIGAWSGINGSFGGYSPTPSTTGIWLAKNSKYELSNGVYYTIRSMESAPNIEGTQLKWDTAKYTTWSW
jgi:hypothetical protein